MKKYIAGLILNILLILLPIGLLTAGVMTGQNIFYKLGIISCVIAFMLMKQFDFLLAEGRQEVEYDEFGRSKRKNIKTLSRKEQDAIDLQKLADMERILSTSQLKKMTKQGSKNPDEDLKKLTGLYPVKQKVKEIEARYKFEQMHGRHGKIPATCRHMVFYGNTGTGKTTVARIITGILYKNKVIKKNKCIEVDGNFLKAGEETATKVKLLTQLSYDGVLFIDEAYTLADGLYGKEAVATLIKEMEDNKERFVCILAGYTKEMDKMLDSNTGFKSRIKEYINFPDYTTEEMKAIFTNMANDIGFIVTSDALDNFEIRLAKEKQLKTYGNARTARNLLDEAIDKHTLNYAEEKISEEDKFKLLGIDFKTNTKM